MGFLRIEQQRWPSPLKVVHSVRRQKTKRKKKKKKKKKIPPKTREKMVYLRERKIVSLSEGFQK